MTSGATEPALAERLRAALEPQPEILEAYLFGSQVRGTATERSDVDIAVYVDDERIAEPPYGHASAIGTLLMGVVGHSRVDVVLLDDAPPLLYHRVLRDGVRLFARDPRATARREAEAISRYCDWVPVQRRMDAIQRRRIALGQFGR